MEKTITTSSGRNAEIRTFNKAIQLFTILERKMKEFDLTEGQKEEIREDIFIMARKDLETTRHVLNVTLTAMEIAQFLGKSQRPYLFSGPGHDIGKRDVKETILNAEKYGRAFGDEERKALKQHPIDAFYHFLNQGKTYSALMAVNHHRHGSKPYPKKLPIEAKSLPHLRKIQANIDSKVLTIADNLDALLERPTSFLRGKPITIELVKAELIRFAPKAASTINLLFEKGFMTQERLRKSFIYQQNELVRKRLAQNQARREKVKPKKATRRKR